MQDMPTVESAIQETYRDMVCTMTFDKITVSELCRRASVSRKTFYEHYEDASDLLKRILREDLTRNTERLKPLFANKDAEMSAPLLTERMYQGILEEREFYAALVAKGNAQKFTHLASRCFIELHERLSQRDGGHPSLRRSYAARFGAAGTAAVMVQWIRSGFDVPVHDLAQWMSDWGMAASREGFGE